MNTKDIPDAELNEMVARAAGWEPCWLCVSPAPYDGVPDPICDEENCPSAILASHGVSNYKDCRQRFLEEPPDYCNSAEAQADLKRWLCQQDVVFETHCESPPEKGYENYWWRVNIWLPKQRFLSGEPCNSERHAATEGRALAEAFVMAFGKEKE